MSTKTKKDLVSSYGSLLGIGGLACAAMIVFHSMSTLAMTQIGPIRRLLEGKNIPEWLESGLTLAFLLCPGLVAAAGFVWVIKTKFLSDLSLRLPNRKVFESVVLGSAFGLLGLIIGLFVSTHGWMFILGFYEREIQREILKNGYSIEPPSNDAPLADSKNYVFFVKNALKVAAGRNKKWVERNINGKTQKYSENEILTDAWDQLLRGDNEPYSWQIKQASKILSQKDESLQGLIDNIHLAQFSWGVDWDQDIFSATQFPNMSRVLFLGRILSTRALLQYQSGNKQEGIATFGALFRVAHAVGSHPTWIGNILSSTLLHIGFRTMRRVYPEGVPKNDLQKFGSMLDLQYLKKSQDETFRIELIVHPNQLSDYIDKEESLTPKVIRWAYMPFITMDINLFSRYGLRMMQATELRYPDAISELKNVVREVEKSGMIFSGMGLSGVTNLYTKATFFLAEAELFEFMVKGDVTGIDPFSNGQIKILREGTSVWLYSVGPDQIDNKTAKYDKKTETGDISWRVHPSVYASWDL